jgi:Ser/Thr protein kinase RdoA (MazF antagonist)
VFDCPRPTLLAELASAIRRVQGIAPFPLLGHYLDGVDKLIAELRGADFLPARASEVFERYAAMPSRYPRDPADQVSTHNDLNPTNILWEQGRVWIVDWELASLNDRYVDPAYVCNQFALNPAEEITFLTHVFAGPPSDQQRARVHLMRQACQMFFAVILFRVAAAARPGWRLSPDDLAAPPLAEVRRQMVQLLASPEGQVQIAAATLNDLLANLKAAGFAEALRIVQT